MSAGRYFVDTNVLVYGADTTEAEKQARAGAWLERLWRERSGRLSVQVLQELYVNLTAKIRRPLALAEARDHVRALEAWQPVAVDRAVLETAWQVQDRYRLSFWDALIVAAARAARCAYLLTEDMQHGQDLGGVEVVDPFRSAP